MSRQDPGAATGGPAARPPGVCACRHLETLHRLTGRRRTACSTHDCGCRGYQPASNVLAFPGAGTTPAPGPRAVPADLDAMGERYVEYCEARDSGRQADADQLAHAVADDIPAWLGEVARIEALRREVAAELDRLTGGA